MTRNEIIEKARELNSFASFKNYLSWHGIKAEYGQIKASSIYDELPKYEAGDVIEIDGREVCIVAKANIGIGYTYIKL